MQNAVALTTVQSSQIAAIGYDPASQTLAVQFLRKGLPADVYNYAPVPQPVYDAFLAAESKGIYFGTNIRKATHEVDGKQVPLYPHTKMDD